MTDAMAKATINKDKGLRVYDKPPNWVHEHVIDDLMGVPSTRRVTMIWSPILLYRGVPSLPSKIILFSGWLKMEISLQLKYQNVINLFFYCFVLGNINFLPLGGSRRFAPRILVTLVAKFFPLEGIFISIYILVTLINFLSFFFKKKY